MPKAVMTCMNCSTVPFRAAAESVEEAILNSLCTADRVTATGMGVAGNETVTLAGFSEFLPALLPALRGRG